MNYAIKEDHEGYRLKYVICKQVNEKLYKRFTCTIHTEGAPISRWHGTVTLIEITNA